MVALGVAWLSLPPPGVAQQDGGPSRASDQAASAAAGGNRVASGLIALWRVTPKVPPRAQYTSQELAGKLMQTPTTNLFPGSVAVDPGVVNPVADDPGAAERGKRHYEAFNCVGCHAPNGSGGEGPALSNAHWIYGSEPADIYLTLVHGRPNGMPAFGAMLPDQTIWELVAYIHSMARDPGTSFGRTISRSSPQLEQVPAEFVQTTEPWQHLQTFMNGQRPPRPGSEAQPAHGATPDKPDAG